MERQQDSVIDEILNKLERVRPVGDGTNIVALCPFHKETKPSFSLNIKTGLFYCFACGAKGNLAKLTAHLFPGDTDKVSDAIAYTSFASLEDIFEPENSEDLDTLPLSVLDHLVPDVEAFYKISRSPSKQLVKLKHLLRFRVGVYDDALCFPYITPDFKVAGIKCRHLYKNGPKYYVLNSAQAQFIPPNYKAKFNLTFFGGHLVDVLWEDHDTVFLVESPKDVLILAAFDIPALATVQKLSPEQLTILSRFDRVVLMPDNDAAGRRYIKWWSKALEGLVHVEIFEDFGFYSTVNATDLPTEWLVEALKNYI